MTHQHSASRTTLRPYDFPLLDVSVRSDGASAWMVELSGELDLATGELLRGHLDSYNALGGHGGRPQKIVYLLSGLEFIDASGLHALLEAVDGHGPSTITIRDPSPQVRRLLEIVGLDSMIETPNR